MKILNIMLSNNETFSCPSTVSLHFRALHPFYVMIIVLKSNMPHYIVIYCIQHMHQDYYQNVFL